jgi:hypothetical protein
VPRKCPRKNGAKAMAEAEKIPKIDPAEVEILLRHEVASITVKTARAGLHPLFHQRVSTGMNKELPGQCNLIT